MLSYDIATQQSLALCSKGFAILQENSLWLAPPKSLKLSVAAPDIAPFSGAAGRSGCLAPADGAGEA